MANQAAWTHPGGFRQDFCLAGVGGELPGFVHAAREAAKMVVLDGCAVGCARASFQKAGVPLRGHVVLTELGIAKNKVFDLKADELARVMDAARRAAQAQG